MKAEKMRLYLSQYNFLAPIRANLPHPARSAL